MYTVIAKWYIQANENAVLQGLRDLATQVEAQEPDTWMYLVHAGNQQGSTPPPAPGEVVFVEAYKDFNALLQHVNGKPFQTFLSQYGADFVPLAEPNKGPFMLVESLARLAGFVRPHAAESAAKVTGH
jgi:quinol monooxygenase YgiN